MGVSRDVDLHEMAIMLLNHLGEHISVIDSSGAIVYVNQPWCQFANSNDCDINNHSWLGVNYLSVCERAQNSGDDFGERSYQGIKQVIHDKKPFYLEYPCDSPNLKRWFMKRVMPLQLTHDCFYVITHHDITQRKLAEEAVRQSAQYDGLTQIFNRQYGDLFLHNEFRRCQRLSLPITVAFIDIDDFKQLNDRFGHQYGDQCIKGVAKLISGLCQRPSDCCYRYGGDEFVIVWGNMRLVDAQKLTEKLFARLSTGWLDDDLLSKADVGFSIGLAHHSSPGMYSQASTLLKQADNALYRAKSMGKNQTQFNVIQEPLFEQQVNG